jgi:hypothetical protein
MIQKHVLTWSINQSIGDALLPAMTHLRTKNQSFGSTSIHAHAYVLFDRKRAPYKWVFIGQYAKQVLGPV